MVNGFRFGRQNIADGPQRTLVVEPVHPSSVANSTSCRLLPERQWITSALYRLLIVSASALS